MILAIALVVAPLQQGAPSPMRLERVLAPGSLQGAVELVSRPGDPRLYIVQLDGQVRVLENGALRATPLLDLRGRVDLSWQTGLRAFAFHPDHDQNGEAFVWFDSLSPTSGHELVLARVHRDAADPTRLDVNTLDELMREPQTDVGHGGGRLAFGPDGMLYGALGDGGLQYDPFCNAQNDALLMGTMFRIDVDAGHPYTIPYDNPLVGTPGARPEIWHSGLRHPWKWSFDRATGELWIADVGQDQREEIDLVPPGVGGLDFGWKAEEGDQCNDLAGCPPTVDPCGSGGYTAPLYEYPHSMGCSVTGGYVYRGDDIPDLYGAYVFADYCAGRVWVLRQSAGVVQSVYEISASIAPGPGQALTNPATLGEAHDGELYFGDLWDGELYRLVRRTGAARFCEAAPNVNGTRAQLDWAGSLSVSAANLTLSVSRAPANTVGVIFYGGLRTQVPLGNGFRCISGNLYRLPVALADAGGNFATQVDYSRPPAGGGPGAFLAGSTWNFQAWYRDVGGPGGASFNLSDALSILFAP